MSVHSTSSRWITGIITIVIVEPLARSAHNILQAEGYGFVHVRAGDGYLGWRELPERVGVRA